MSQPALSALRPAPLAAAVAATAVTMLALDLTWLGVLAKTYYAEALGPLEREQPLLPGDIAQAVAGEQLDDIDEARKIFR